MAVLWLGDNYLCDQTAQKLREIAFGRLALEGSGLRGSVLFGTDSDFLRFWVDEPDVHIAFVIRIKGDLILCMKIFDVFSASIVVTENADQYGSGQLDPPVTGFIRIDPVAKTERQCALAEEFSRVAMRFRGQDAFQ